MFVRNNRLTNRQIEMLEQLTKYPIEFDQLGDVVQSGSNLDLAISNIARIWQERNRKSESFNKRSM